MSYYIEKHKRVVTFPFQPQPGMGYHASEVMIFLTAGSCNNVSPRTYDWDVCAIREFSEWSGEIQLPSAIWQSAHDADGGGIKPGGRDCSGTAYIRQWKQAVTERYPCVRDGTLLWHPRVSAWHWKDSSGDLKHEPAEINEQGADLFSPKYKHLRAPLHAAFKRLFEKPLSGSNTSTHLYSLEAMNDAVFLWMNREHLPTSFHLCDSDWCEFLLKGKQAPVPVMSLSELVAA